MSSYTGSQRSSVSAESGGVSPMLPVEPVAGAQAHHRHSVQDVELRDAQPREAVDPNRAPQARDVEPAAAAGPPRRRAELAAPGGEAAPRLVVQLGGERPGAHPGRVRLGDPEDVADVARAESASRRRPAGGGVRRRDEGKGALVDVQAGTLRAFEQHAFAGIDGRMQRRGHVGEQRPHPLDCRFQLVADLGDVDRVRAQRPREHEVVMLVEEPKLLVEPRGVEEVAGAHRPAGGLVLVRGADPAPRVPIAAAPRAASRARSTAAW